MIAIIYKINTGEILRNVDMPEDFIPYQVGEGEAFLETQVTINDGIHYVDNDVVLEKVIQPILLNKTTINADGIEELIFSNVPLASIKIDNLQTKETLSGTIEGTDSFSTTIPGTYKIKIISFPYLDFEATIEAV
jgi:hypothetical protein